MGRKSTYTKEVGEEIERLLADGIPLAEICRKAGMPGLRTVYDWTDADKEFGARIARARDCGEDVIAADCLAIADDGTRDYAETEDGREVVNHDHIQRSKLRIDTRLKLLAKWNPKRWGERTVLAGDKDSPLFSGAVESLTDEQLAAIVAASGSGAATSS